RVLTMLRKQLLMLGFIGSAGLMTGCGESSEPTEKTELETTEQKVSYVIGLNLANNFEEGGITIDPDALVLAMRDKRDGVEPRLTEEESNDVMRSFQEQEMERRAQEQLAQAEAFLAQNREKEGVETTDSGLQYKVVEEGDGA